MNINKAAKKLIFIIMLAFCATVFAAGNPSTDYMLQGNPTPGSNVDQLATPPGPLGNSAGVPNVDQDQLANGQTQLGNPRDVNNQDNANIVDSCNGIDQNTCGTHTLRGNGRSCFWVTISSGPDFTPNACN